MQAVRPFHAIASFTVLAACLAALVVPVWPLASPASAQSVVSTHQFGTWARATHRGGAYLRPPTALARRPHGAPQIRGPGTPSTPMQARAQRAQARRHARPLPTAPRPPPGQTRPQPDASHPPWTPSLAPSHGGGGKRERRLRRGFHGGSGARRMVVLVRLRRQARRRCHTTSHPHDPGHADTHGHADEHAHAHTHGHGDADPDQIGHTQPDRPADRPAHGHADEHTHGHTHGHTTATPTRTATPCQPRGNSGRCRHVSFVPTLA